MGAIVVFVYGSVKWTRYSDDVRDWKLCEQRVLVGNDEVRFHQATIEALQTMLPTTDNYLIVRLRENTPVLQDVKMVCKTRPSLFTSFNALI